MLNRLYRPRTKRGAAAVLVTLYLGALVGTFVHLGAHPHIYSTVLNAFVHPLKTLNDVDPGLPAGTLPAERSDPDGTDHLLTFYTGTAPWLALVVLSACGESIEEAPPARRCQVVVRVLLSEAPKHSPPTV